MPILAFLAVAAIQLQNLNQVTAPSARQFLIPPAETQELYAFGHKDTMADALWIRVIQDFDSCGKDGRAEIRDYKSGVALAELSVCDYSWPFQMINLVTDLAPRFEAVYHYGGINLSFLIRDGKGADFILRKGIKLFPKNGNLYYAAAYNALEELKDESAAAELFKLASENGAPGWLLSSAARLFAKNGRLDYAIKIIEERLAETGPNDKYRPQLEYRLKELNKELRSL